MIKQDTIAAIATPPGEGAVGIVRISGPEAPLIGAALFSRPLRDRRAVFGIVRDPARGTPLDDGLALLMLGPRSYTAEHTVEFQVHGGSRSLQRVLDTVLAAGARPAERGEFTLRAFLNGRLDLAQAEAVLQVVEAHTDAGIDLALAGLAGKLSARIGAARGQALELLAYLGARADFPDEDVPLRDLAPELAELGVRLGELVAGAAYGIVQRDGVRIAIVGPPNAGKSSLLNRMLRQDRAIVTPIPGTTRDTIAEHANLCGLPVVLSDTAGLRATADSVELAGIERTRAVAAASDIVLLVLDASRAFGAEAQELVDAYGRQPLVIALNKCDLAQAIAPDLPAFQTAVALPVSALTGTGLPELEAALIGVATAGLQPPAEGVALTTIRQREAARRAAQHVAAARAGLAAGWPEDLLAVDLAAAVTALGELTGEDVTEDLLGVIFSRFCIGK